MTARRPTPWLQSIVRRLLPVTREERSLAAFLYVLAALMVLSDWVGKIGADSLFVKRFGVAYIPLMYLVTPVAMLATSALIFAVIDRVQRRTLLMSYVAFVMLASVAIQAALPLGGVVYPVAYVFAHGVKETIYLVFWIYAGNLYDSDQAKRLFPLFAGAVLVGKIVGGIIAAGLADVIHAENFIGAQAVGFLLCLALIIAYRKRLPEGQGKRAAERPAGLAASVRDSLKGYRTVASDRLLRTFGVGVFLWYFLMQAGNYLYLVGLDTQSALKDARQSEDAFTLLYASVYTSSSLVALGIQTFITAGLLRRLGVGVLLFIFPLWYLLSYTSAFIWWIFPTAVAIQLGERVVIPAVHRPTTELVYGLVSARIRPRARAFLSGGVNALGNIGAALVLILTVWLSTGPSAVLGIASALSAAFVANAWALRGAIGARIAANLRSADAELRRNAIQMLPGEGRAVPTAALRAALQAAPQDVEAGVRLALTRRGALAVAAETNGD